VERESHAPEESVPNNADQKLYVEDYLAPRELV
jgi:hypothetical protein